MADKVITKRLDDLHALEGEEIEADRRYSFVFEGTPYQLDLSDDHAAEFERMFAFYLNAATPLKETTTPRGKKLGAVKAPSGGSGTRKISKATAAKIREWAIDNGMILKAKGPLPVEVKQKYAQNHGIEVEALR